MTDIRRPSHDIRRVVSIGMGLIFVTFGVVGVWAATAPLSSAVIVRGVVEVESNRQTVQHFEGGIISKILVHEGDHVRAGQLLFELNPVEADAALESARNQLFSLLAKADRLAAERDNLAKVTFSPEVQAQAGDPLVAHAMADELQQFGQRRETLANEISVLQQRILEKKTEIEGIDQQRTAMQQQLALIDEEMTSLNELYQKDLVPKPRILSLQRDRAQLLGQIGTAVADKAKAQESIGETELQMNQARQEFHEDVDKQITDVQTQSADVRQKYAVAEDAAKRIDITSPMDGTAQSLRIFTVGGVVRPGDPLVDIVPDHEKMIVEARFSPNDVDSVHVGQTVQLRFSTFHSRRIPVIQGVIRSVSQDRMVDEASKQPFYLAILDVPDPQLPPLIRNNLRAGLPVEVVATTGSRTALQYALKPLTDALTGAVRER